MKEVSSQQLDKFLQTDNASHTAGQTASNGIPQTNPNSPQPAQPPTPQPANPQQALNNLQGTMSSGNGIITELNQLIKGITDLWDNMKGDILTGADKKKERMGYDRSDLKSRNEVSYVELVDKSKQEKSQDEISKTQADKKAESKADWSSTKVHDLQTAKRTWLFIKKTFEQLPEDTKLSDLKQQWEHDKEQLIKLIQKVLNNESVQEDNNSANENGKKAE